MLYGFVDGEIVGRVSIRHRLDENLKSRGGHLGYSVAKRCQKKGYATAVVKQSLYYCRTLGLTSIMLTCAEDNTASWKIIEHFQGVLQERRLDPEAKEMIRVYWLHLQQS